MPRRLIEAGAGKPLLDIASYARRGPAGRAHLSQAEIEIIQRTVTRTPEVMVKVLTRGANTFNAVRAHLAYLSRDGELELDTGDGERIVGKAEEARLLEDWDLDLDQYRRCADVQRGRDRAPPKLVHKILFSMPPGTPPKKVLEAVKNFARVEFALQHRYAMVLHTDEPHPHVHLIVKAVSEQGVRLNIRKATLRRWRGEFAQHLRLLGVAANATERAVRGSSSPRMSDGVYRTSQRGELAVLLKKLRFEPRSATSSTARAKPTETREAIRRGWMAVSGLLKGDRRFELAAHVKRFVEQMPSPQTARTADVSDRTQSPSRDG